MGGKLRGDGGAGRILWAPGVDWDASLGFRSDRVGKLGSVGVQRAWELGGAMLRAPARGGGCIATGSLPRTRLWCWGQGRAGRLAPAARGTAKSRSPRDRVASLHGQPGALQMPGPGGDANPSTHSPFPPRPKRWVPRPWGASGEWPPSGSAGRAVRWQGCLACSLSRSAWGGVDRVVCGWEELETPGCVLRPGLQPRGSEQGFLACAWRYFVSACLYPICMCAEAPVAPACVYFMCAL